MGLKTAVLGAAGGPSPLPPLPPCPWPRADPRSSSPSLPSPLRPPRSDPTLRCQASASLSLSSSSRSALLSTLAHPLPLHLSPLARPTPSPSLPHRASSVRLAHPLSSCPQNPAITELALFDVVPVVKGVAADIGHVDTPAVTTGYVKDEDGLKGALTGADLVVIPAGVPRKVSSTSLSRAPSDRCWATASGDEAVPPSPPRGPAPPTPALSTRNQHALEHPADSPCTRTCSRA